MEIDVGGRDLGEPQVVFGFDCRESVFAFREQR
jgi:hypothetical protein